MGNKFLMILAAGTLVGAAPANASIDETMAANVSAGRGAAAATAAKPVKKVCKLIERTGSHVRERICLAKADWARVEKHLEESF